jgi:hypothetical protein
MWSQELPWNPFVSKPAPPAGIVSHYHVFLIGEGWRWERKRERGSMLSNTELYYNSNVLRPHNE